MADAGSLGKAGVRPLAAPTHQRSLMHHRTAGGNYHFDQCTWIRVDNVQLTTEFSSALFYAANSDADTVGLQFRDSFPYALAIVAHADKCLAFLLIQGDPNSVGLGMPENVGQSFLHNSKNGRLQLRRQTRKLLWLHFKFRLDAAALVEAIQVPGDSRPQADLIQQGRMEQVRHGSNLLNSSVDDAACFGTNQTLGRS